MADICVVCGEEITSENREVYKSINDPEGLVLHDYCLTKYVSEEQEEQAKQDETEINTKIAAARADLIDKVSLQEIKDKSVYIKGFSMPFGEMVAFIFKWTMASIPTAIFLAILFLIFTAIIS